jgi:hypothetical protein
MYDGRVARMVRKQVYIEERQDRELKRRARELGVTEAELIRRGLELLATPSGHRLLPRALDALAESERYVRKHRRMKVPQTGRGWTREELYEERLARYGPRRHERPRLPPRPA